MSLEVPGSFLRQVNVKLLAVGRWLTAAALLPAALALLGPAVLWTRGSDWLGRSRAIRRHDFGLAGGRSARLTVAGAMPTLWPTCPSRV